MTTTLTRRGLLVGALAGSATVGVGLGRISASEASTSRSAMEASVGGEEPSTVDLGFCTDMATHHVQALALCQRVLGRDTGGEVQAAAAEVLQNQAIEVGQMRAWLTDWGASTSPPTWVMGWMPAADDDGSTTESDDEHVHDGGAVLLAEMPGYATDEELQELSRLEGTAQGRCWLELMRAHHVGGVAMAEVAAELAGLEKVRRLASTQATTQTYEIAVYDQLLAGAYADA
ncbi:MAG: DUF305 domain-containing protein [Acidimicrobiales bacterium]|nr:DUF305 domain-containing protein [Acidimicrobiales bacterium]